MSQSLGELARRIYLAASRMLPSWAWNALAVLAPVTAAIDRFSADDNGALLLIRATKVAS